MITAVKKRRRGQSILEFALLLPIFVTLLVTLVQMSGAINTAIVNARFARQQMHYLMFNNRNYLERNFTQRQNGQINRIFYIGVEDKTHSDEDDLFMTGPGIIARAPVRSIGPKPGEDTVQGFVARRQKVRIYEAVFTCLPPLGVNRNAYFSEGNLQEDTFAGNYAYCVK